MLISCPKCHSVYEIPDDLIAKTGQKFRCQACSHVWHAMPEDALGYQKDEDAKPLIEPLDVKVPPYRNYPANQDNYQVPADTKSGQKTPSSEEILLKEGDKNATPPLVHKPQELTLTSDMGTSFTINAATQVADDRKTPYLTEKEEGLHPNQNERLLQDNHQKSLSGWRKLIYLLLIAILAVLLRREIVWVYPTAENLYHTIGLSGLSNPQYLKFKNIAVSEEVNDGKKMFKITADIVNPSRYATNVPSVRVSLSNQVFQPQKTFLKANETTKVEIILPELTQNEPVNLTLGFQNP